MAILLVTYDLKQPGRDYKPVHDFLKTNFNWCKGLESVWLIDTQWTTTQVRDGLMQLIDQNDSVFVVRLSRGWAAFNYYCADWLNDPARTW